jgi:RNA polymerase sigma factor (TIGR02999 family)
MSELAQILQRLDQGDPKASEALLPLVYQNLRQLAAVQMAQQAPGQTLQPTALVHEAWLKLAGGDPKSWNDRKHFFCAAAEAMRQILIDRARKKKARRHGGGVEHVDVDGIEISGPAPDEKLLELNEALDVLATSQPGKAEVVKLRFFAGLTEKEISDLLGITERTVRRYWSYAQVWLFDYLSGNSRNNSPGTDRS